MQFKKKENGTTIFFPYGRRYVGYNVTAEEERLIKTFLKKYELTFFISTMISIFFFGYFTFLLLLLFLPLYYIRIRKFVKPESRTTEKISLSEELNNFSTSTGPRVIFIILLGCILMLLGTIWTFSKDKIFGVLDILFFGIGIIIFSKLLSTSLRLKKHKK